MDVGDKGDDHASLRVVSIKCRISSTRQAVVRLPSFTAAGKRPSRTPAHHVDLPIGKTDVLASERNSPGYNLRSVMERRVFISHAAEDLHMGAIAVFTETGNTARMISKYRPKAAIYAFSQLLPVCNRMNLLWGVSPVRTAPARSAEDMVTTAERELLRQGRIKVGDVLGVVAGTQMASGSTNFMRLHVVPPAT